MNKNDYGMGSILTEIRIPWTSIDPKGSAVMSRVYDKEVRGNEWDISIYLGKSDNTHNPHELAYTIAQKLSDMGYIVMHTEIIRHENWQDVPEDNFTINVTFIAPKDQK